MRVAEMYGDIGIVFKRTCRKKSLYPLRPKKRRMQ